MQSMLNSTASFAVGKKATRKRSEGKDEQAGYRYNRRNRESNKAAGRRLWEYGKFDVP